MLHYPQPKVRKGLINTIHSQWIGTNLLIHPALLLCIINKGRFFTKAGFDWPGGITFLPPAAYPRTTGSGIGCYGTVSY